MVTDLLCGMMMIRLLLSIAIGLLLGIMMIIHLLFRKIIDPRSRMMMIELALNLVTALLVRIREITQLFTFYGIDMRTSIWRLREVLVGVKWLSSRLLLKLWWSSSFPVHPIW
jgi:hypothetical protein